MLPVTKDAVRVVMVTTSAITVSWFSYAADAGTRSRGVAVSSYDVEMTTDDRKWTLVVSVPATTQTDHDGRYRYRVRRLVPGTPYRFRVVINWLNDNKPMRSVPGPPSSWTRTHCGQLLATVTSPLIGSGLFRELAGVSHRTVS